MLGASDIDHCFGLALNAGLSEPSRRSLLLAWLPRQLVASLAHHPSPADQLRSDLMALNSVPLQDGRPAIAVWLENAERLVGYLPNIPDQFRTLRERATQRAREGVSPEGDPTASGTPEPQKMGVLFLSAEPRGHTEDRLAKLLGNVRDQIRADSPDRLDMSDVHRHVDQNRISEIIQDSTQDILHFAGSGIRRDGESGWLVIDDGAGNEVPVHPETTMHFIEEAVEHRKRTKTRPLRCAIFSAAYSDGLAERLQRAGLVNTTIGNTREVRDVDVQAFSRRFYQYLAQGRSFVEAFKAGVAQVAIQRRTSPRNVSDFVIFSKA